MSRKTFGSRKSEAGKKGDSCLNEDFHDITFRSSSIRLEGYAICTKMMRPTEKFIRTHEDIINPRLCIRTVSSMALECKHSHEIPYSV